MITLTWIVIFFALLLTLAYKRASLIVSTIAVFIYLLLATRFGSLSIFSKIILWLLFLGTAVPLNIWPLRRTLLTKPLLSWYQKIRPSMSSTEREALSVGTVGWEGELFSGMPDWDKWKAYPIPTLTSEEKQFLDNEVDQLCGILNNFEINHKLFCVPDDIWNFIKEKGFLGLIIPKRYGGKEFSALGHSAVITKVASCSNAVATMIAVPNSLGPAELLLKYGTEAQKNHYLPRLAKGEEIPCFALTSPEAGSDAGAMPDHGIVCKGEWKGESVLGIRLEWDKRYITLAPIATLLGLAFKLFDPDHLLGEKEDLGITCALVPTNTPGVVIGRKHLPLNSAFPNGPTQGKDVFIPIDWIIGGVERAGQGWHMLMECLSVGRALSLPSLSTGGSKVAAFVSGAYSQIRKQFNVSLGHFEGIEEALTRIAGHTYLIEATRLFTVAAIDAGERPAVPSAISKYHTTELARRVINDAMDIHGGKGICMGPRNYLAQPYIEAPIAITVEGANILTRCMIIFGQGAMRCHPYLLKEFTASQDPDEKKGLLEFDKALFGHIGFLISNKVRAFCLGLFQGYCALIPSQNPLKKYYQQLTRFSAAFAWLADVSVLTLGSELKRRERLSGRLADALSMLYLGSAVLKHFENQGSPEEDLPLVEWCCQTLLFSLQNALDATLRNFPKKGLKIALRATIFPLGLTLKTPDDALSQRVAHLLLAQTAARYRLTQGIYTAVNDINMVGLIDQVLGKVIASEALEKKLHDAERRKEIQGKTRAEILNAAVIKHILTQEEVAILKETDIMRKSIIAVDDF